jgi:hypothetical protein
MKTRVMKKKDNEKVLGMVRNIMNKALDACGGEELWNKWKNLAPNNGLSELDILLGDTQGDLAARLNELEARTPKKAIGHELNWKIDFVIRQASALCLLVDYGQPGKGIRASVFAEMKGIHFRQAARIAGRQLWEASGEMDEPLAVAPIILDDDGPDDTGLCFGRRFFHRDTGVENSIDGLTPLPSCALLEQLALAKAGEKKAFGGEIAQKTSIIYLGVAPGFDWKECVDRINRIIQAKKA